MTRLSTFKPGLLAWAALPLLAVGGIQNAVAYTVPTGLGYGTSVAPAGMPGFYNTSQVKFEKLSNGNYRLTGTGTGAYEFDATPTTPGWSVSSGAFKLVANFTSNLSFNQSGSYVQIDGKIPTYNGSGSLNYGYSGSGDVKSKVSTLYRADLLAFDTDNSPWGLGFSTDASDDKGWASQFMTSNESVWFFNNGDLWGTIGTAINGNSKKSTWSITLNNVGTITTVPVPAAAWMFGSGLIALMGVRRKRSSNALAA